MSFAGFTTLSFDCYGTLIDWETGIERCLEAIDPQIDADAWIGHFSRNETRVQSEHPTWLYPEILAEVYRRVAEDMGRAINEAEASRFAGSVPDWPPFDDTVGALQYLKRHFRLVILSNIDRKSFAATNAKLGVEFDLVLTAEEIGSYKPDLRNFEHLLGRMGEMGVRKGEILHVAESLYHDHAPCRELGIKSCWIDRRRPEKAGATPWVNAEPSMVYKNLADFAEAHQQAVGGG